MEAVCWVGVCRARQGKVEVSRAGHGGRRAGQEGSEVVCEAGVCRGRKGRQAWVGEGRGDIRV